MIANMSDDDFWKMKYGNKGTLSAALTQDEIKKYYDGLNKKYKEDEQEEDLEDVVNKPKHYALWPEYSIEVRDLMKLLADQLDEKGYSGLLISDYIQAMQYLLRWHNKNGAEDIKKSVWYLNKMLEQLGDVE